MFDHLSKAIALSGFFLLNACGTIYMNAPTGSNVTVLSEDARADVRIEKKVWFKWWGNEPVNEADVNAASIIEQEGLTEARIRMTNTLADGIITTIAGIVGFPRRTLIVEGNRERSIDSIGLPDPDNLQSIDRVGGTNTGITLSHDNRHRKGE